jgi:phage head maturation protease
MTETREARASWLSARFAPATYDEDARTVEVVWSTGADVRRRDWDGEYIERLSMDAGAVDMSRLSNGAPVLNSHDAWSLSSVLGVVERAWIEGGEGRAVLRFSDRAEVQPILRDIREGILRNISVGYDVMKWEEGKDKDGKRFKRAVRWQPAEISLVPIPADASAQVRAAEMPADGAGDAGDGRDVLHLERVGCRRLGEHDAGVLAHQPLDVQLLDLTTNSEIITIYYSEGRSGEQRL